MYLQCAVECPDKVQLVIDSLVFAASYEGGPKFLFRGWFTFSYRRQTGLLQMNIQLLHLIGAVLMIACDKTTHFIIILHAVAAKLRILTVVYSVDH